MSNALTSAWGMLDTRSYTTRSHAMVMDSKVGGLQEYPKNCSRQETMPVVRDTFF